ncbi:unnamed protein product [Effrenium voratum]|uniref:Pentatricopeptide repeat-containing protein, chloroplastic n=1 Tax=Effrenium voratum TaxID=2562239 RepID=A0AA36N875_9DINO|nr:unnamed protein product [Effrenium voratum]
MSWKASAPGVEVPCESNLAAMAKLRGASAEEAARLLQAMARVEAQVDHFHCGLIIGKGSWQLALRVLKMMRGMSVRAAASTFNAAMTACEKQSLWQRGSWLLLLARQRAVAPDTVSYNIRLRRSWPGCLASLSEMRQLLLQPDEFTSSSLLAAHKAGAGHGPGAERRPPRRRRLAPRRAVGASAASLAPRSGGAAARVLALAASDGAWRFALRVLSAMRRARAQVNEVCLTAAAAAFEDPSDWRRAVLALAPLPAMRVAAEWVSCQALCGHWRLSLQLAGSGVLGVAAISKARGWQLSLQSLGGSAAWNAAMFATSWQLGLVLLGNAICHSVADQTSFNTAASALKELNWQGSMALLHRAVVYRLQLEEVGWNIAMDAAGGGGGWQRPLQLLSTMACRALRPSEASLGCCLGGLWQISGQLLRSGGDLLSWNLALGQSPWLRALDQLGAMSTQRLQAPEPP